MSRELWATYSVKDHFDQRLLAADVMLFDRLVFPVPATPRFPANSGTPNESGPVEWVRNDAEWTRWVEKRWRPSIQQRVLDRLGAVSRKVAWDSSGSPAYEHYRRDMAQLAVNGLPDYAFLATRTALTRDLPSHVSGVAAVGPSYRSIAQMERDLGIKRTGATPQLPGGALANILAWEFMIPDPDNPDNQRLSSDEFLTETVDFVTGDAEFRRHRTAFVEWQQGFLDREGLTDRESIQRAVTDMRELLEQAKVSATKLKLRTVTRHVFRVAPSAVTAALAAAGVVGGVEAAVGGVFLSLGSIVVDEALFKGAEKGRPVPTAFVQDARRRLGWK